jgi:hypothetical protein
MSELRLIAILLTSPTHVAAFGRSPANGMSSSLSAVRMERTLREGEVS